MIKLIVSDLDGTLLNEKNEVLPNDIVALQKCAAQNLDICIATGRMDNEILEVLKMVDGRYHRISQNGAFVFTKDDNELHSVYFNRDVANRIYKRAKDENSITLVYNQNTHFVEKVDDEVKKIEEKMFFPFIEKPDISTAIGQKINSSKITILAYDVEDRQRDIMELFSEDVDTFISAKYVLDVMPKNISKGVALTTLLNHLNLTADEVACIGDSYNDIPMFNLTSNSFAMSHAANEVKSHANHTVDCVSEAIEIILEKNERKG